MGRFGDKLKSAGRLGLKIGAGALAVTGAALGVKSAIDSGKAHADAAKTIGGAIAAEVPGAIKHAAGAKIGVNIGNPGAAANIAYHADIAKIDPIGHAHHLANPPAAQPKLPPVPKVGLSTSGSGSAGLHIVAGKPQSYGPALPPELAGKKGKFKGKFQKLKPKLPKKLKKKK